MEVINTEKIVSSLLGIGFEQVDGILFTIVLGKIILEQRNNFKFESSDNEYSNFFNTYIEQKDSTYRIKNKYNYYSNVSIDEHYLSLQCALKYQSGKLTEYLESLDFKDIIVKKINMLGFNQINKYQSLLSTKEKMIVSEIFGIDKMYKDINKTTSKSYSQVIYEQEDKDIDNAINTLNKVLTKKKDN